VIPYGACVTWGTTTCLSLDVVVGQILAFVPVPG